MDESQQVAGLIGDIYDAAIDPTLWAATLQRTCEYIGGATGTLLSQDWATGSARYYFQWGNDPEYLKTYQETYVKLNPVLVSTLFYTKPGDVRSTVDLMPLDEFFASRFYKEWVAPQGLVDSVFVLVDKSGSSYAILAVTRHQRHGLVDDAARQRMRLLAPHFRRAVAIGQIIDSQRAKAKALSETLDGIAAATFLVDAQGHILHANTSGQSMLAERDALVTNGRRLQAIDKDASLLLNEVFAAAGSGDAAVGIKGIAIPLKIHDDVRFVAHVLPLTSGARRTANNSAAAAVFVCEVLRDLPHPAQSLVTAYGLTPAELRVLMASVNVGTVPEVAAVLGISRATVSTHLQHLFEKTGSRRQADLVELVAGFMSPLA
jgi:DNA-binding CsgD family transcriptional regulator